jgi:hypothetical protein
MGAVYTDCMTYGWLGYQRTFNVLQPPGGLSDMPPMHCGHLLDAMYDKKVPDCRLLQSGCQP